MFDWNNKYNNLIAATYLKPGAAQLNDKTKDIQHTN